ncbi:secretion pathway protein Sls2/Rcy1 [Cordyceps fumosorosea ARSEF 2679]|uniref:Secretion pathway protein Sls2/Rcy1 n=1 Tax=Cordyceps fumosorosea (strain ARSEF 2679) TaxID=1081104 RepID=A0A167YFD1_CORFA|nr:secretion pathway protein Sls2/Rcy1 [Cordyceps fumosorosea ARSEF 2679]OAA66259.1 secretion pathway protein Sls2/Rcy1 [Cordyceps fumosorosea ARSEF 2679]
MAAYNANGGGSRGRSILSALAATEMLDRQSKLPAEILVAVLDYLPVADQMRVARTSRRMQEMVYEDPRWVSRLKSMGCWDEREARQRFEEAVRRRREQAAAAAAAAAAQNGTNKQTTTTLFDASTEEQRRKRAVSELRDGFETMTVGAPANTNNAGADGQAAYLDVLVNAKSIRGAARQEYGKIYGALAPFYFDIVKARTHADPLVFQAFRDPETQARMLANLRRFARSDWAAGCMAREAKLEAMTGIFESAVMREFEQGYEFWDVDGRMRRFGHVLHALNGAKSAVEVFIRKHPILNDTGASVNPIECIHRGQGADDVSLAPARQFFERLLAKVNEQAGVIERIFPDAERVFWELVDKVREDVVMEYTTPLFDECHERSPGMYLKAVAGVFEQTMLFFRSLKPPDAGTEEETEAKVREQSRVMVLRVFEPHLDLYLQDELEYFTTRAEDVVSQWEKKLSEQDSSLESYYMSNINRSAEKKDFLSSFRKVVMMPVTALPGMGFSSSSTQASAAATPMPSRPETPGLGRNSPAPGGTATKAAPTDELAAKAALMASKLEGIKSLCSIEVALSLVQAAKASLGRAAPLIPLGGQAGGEAREQCAAVFVALLRILGQRHVKHGFDLAVGHLSQYNPRDVSHGSGDEKTGGSGGVAPLVTFIELVNVGDLISQMVDVFYEQQLATPRIADRNDFLDPAGMAKKRFEQMLDESVAAGLNKGIDVLMDEVEYLQATTQSPTDYNPSPTVAADVTVTDKRASVVVGGASGGGLGIGPSPTAKRIVALVSGHTSMLVGTTDKAMLDVFNGEVGQRLFAAICKHLKRQRVSVDGAITLIADMNLYFEYVRTLRIGELLPYFRALRELSQVFLIDAGAHAKDMATVIADGDRFGGVFRAEEVYEYAQRRADWYAVRKGVERAMYGMDCCVM